MITTESLRNWLRTLTAVPVEVGPDMPDKPDRLMIVTRGSGGRPEMEHLAELGSFIIRARGLPTRSAIPEQDLAALRLAIQQLVGQIELDGHAILSVWPSGPWYPLPGPDNGRRYDFVQVFQYKTSTDI